MEFSDFGNKLGNDTAIANMMSELADAAKTDSNMISMGGGNPARIEAVSNYIDDMFGTSALSKEEQLRYIQTYSAPEGDLETRTYLANYLSKYVTTQPPSRLISWKLV